MWDNRNQFICAGWLCVMSINQSCILPKNINVCPITWLVNISLQNILLFLQSVKRPSLYFLSKQGHRPFVSCKYLGTKSKKQKNNNNCHGQQQQRVSCEFFKLSRNTYFEEPLLTAASEQLQSTHHWETSFQYLTDMLCFSNKY